MRSLSRTPRPLTGRMVLFCLLAFFGTVVGVNRYTEGDEQATEILRIDPALERKQVGRVAAVRARRDTASVEGSLATLKEAAARPDENLMPHLLDAARVHATEGEIIHALQAVFGSYTETPVF